VSFAIRRCDSEMVDGRRTRGFVIEIEAFGCLVELAVTRAR
jgi:hypothetical protein